MDYNLAIHNCMMLQDKMNKTVDPDWTSKGRDWELASIVEMGEFVSHYTYKWWKQETPNYDQAFIELVDVLHFVLSRCIENKIEMDNIVLDFTLTIEDIDDVKSTFSQLVKAIVESLSNECVWFNTSCKEITEEDISRVMRCLIALVYKCGKTAEDFFSTYIAKNTLNIFRQHNGDKKGTYLRKWNGREDNEVLWDIIKNDPAISIDFDLLYDALATKYEEVLNGQNV